MKKTILAGGLALAISVSGSAQTSFASILSDIKSGSSQIAEVNNIDKSTRKEQRALRRAEVSDFVIQQFNSDFPEAKNAAFTVGHNFDEVTYTLKGDNYMAFYDFDAKLVGTTQEKKYEDLPAKGKEEISKWYGDYNVDEVILFDDNEANDTDMWLYGNQFQDQDNYFVALSKPGKKVIVQVTTAGQVSLYKNL